MGMTAAFWLVLVILLAVIELGTMGLYTIWFAGGALVALILALAGVPAAFQLAAFCAVSLLLLFCTRPLAVRYFNGQKREKTNVDSFVGRTAIVTSEIRNLEGKGEAEVNGIPWTARSADDTVIIPVGAQVTVEAVEGVKLIVILKEEG